MNVQEVQEVKKEIRKDLMPEGEKRVEFHAHTNMSTMDALPTVEDLVARAAAWDTRRWPLLTMAMSSPSPWLSCCRKAGIKPLFGMEANIVEDSVPIAYNEADVVLSEATYVVFDVETTGLSAVNNA